MSRETKNIHFHIKATGTSVNDAGQEVGQIEAYGAMFDNVDDGDDVIRPKAFNRTIQNSKKRAQSRNNKYISKMLWQHDPNELIGGWWDLVQDTKGLLGKGDILLATQRGREYYELAKAGMCDVLSIIYDIPDGGAKYDSKTGVRELTEIRLFSMDPVTFAMNDETSVVGVKNASKHKGKTMDKKEAKDFATLFAAAQQADCMEDWGDLINTLTQTMLQVFGMGDAPDPDMSDALTQFGKAVEDWKACAIACDLASYIADQGYCGNTYLSSDTPYVPSSLRAGYMSRPTNSLQGKAGAAISASNQEKIDNHVANIKSLISAHAKAVRSEADDFASVMQGAEQTYAAPNAGTPDDQEGKNRTSYFDTRANRKHSSQSGDTAEEDELAEALATLQLINI